MFRLIEWCHYRDPRCDRRLDWDVWNGMWCALLLKQKIVFLIFALTIYLYSAVKRVKTKVNIVLGISGKVARSHRSSSEICQLLWHVINKQEVVVTAAVGIVKQWTWSALCDMCH